VGAATKKWGFSVRVPVVIDGEARYVLSIIPRPHAILNVLRDSALPPGWLAVIIDANGRIVARSQKHDEFLGAMGPPDVLPRLAEGSGVVETTDLEGRPVVAAYHSSSISDWRVVAWAPQAVLHEPARQGLYFMLGGLAVLTLFVAVIATLVSRLIRAPIAHLLEAASSMGEGNVVSFTPTLMRDVNIVAASLSDASLAIQKRDAHTRFVMRELSHRSKNLLAIVLAIASQSARRSNDFKDFIDKFRRRLAGLSASHDLLVSEGWASATLRSLIRSQLEPFCTAIDNQVKLSGAELRLTPEAAQNLGLALHELATNSTKHGALSVTSGVVGISWETIDSDAGEPRLAFRWIETGGPLVAENRTNGFGSAILARLAPSSLGGRSQLHWHRNGFEWVLEAPLSKLLQGWHLSDGVNLFPPVGSREPFASVRVKGH
jgi:two-component sensor histidine kinase